jgi:hypothetical protein
MSVFSVAKKRLQFDSIDSGAGAPRLRLRPLHAPPEAERRASRPRVRRLSRPARAPT